MTFLLKNPSKVRELVKEGVELLVSYDGETVMKITVPEEEEKSLVPPQIKIAKFKAKDTYRRVDIYDGKYD